MKYDTETVFKSLEFEVNRLFKDEDALIWFPATIKYVFDRIFASMNAIDSIAYAQLLVDYYHDQIHSVNYSSVTIPTRKLYALSAMLQCQLMLASMKDQSDTATIRECLKILDTSCIIVGFPVLESEFRNSCEELQSRLNRPLGVEIEQARTSEPMIAFPIRCYNSAELPYDDVKYLISCNAPFVLRNAASDWPATKLWSNINDLVGKIGLDRTVPVEIGSSYTNEEWSQKLMTIREYAEKFLISNPESIGYIAQHNLLHQFQQLQDDVCLLEVCYEYENVMINTWFGPAGTVSPLHTDPYNNMFVQVVGSKYVRLYSPEQSDRMYPHGGGSLMTNTSKVDVENIDEDKYPLFLNASYVETILNPGDFLFIPVKWWHYVRSLSVSVSISHWLQ